MAMLREVYALPPDHRWTARPGHYSITTIVTLVVLGVLTGVDAPRIQANLATPLVGVWECIMIGLFLLWVVVLAVTLLRGLSWRTPSPERRGGQGVRAKGGQPIPTRALATPT